MSDKLCVIVGMGPQLGLSLARRFAREGFKIAMLARNAEHLAGFASQLSAELSLPAENFLGVTGDASDPDSLRAALAEIEKQAGTPDVLIYNVAVLEPVSPTGLSIERFMNEMMIDAGGALVAAQWAAPLMKARGQGTILHTGGILAVNPHMYYTSISIGKAALRIFNDCLAQELEPEGLRVGTVTIAGMIEAGTAFDPAAIADAFWAYYQRPQDEWEREIIYG